MTILGSLVIELEPLNSVMIERIPRVPLSPGLRGQIDLRYFRES